MQIELGEDLTARGDLSRSLQGCEQVHQRFLAFEYDSSATLGYSGDIACELDTVAHALFGMEQYCSPVTRAAIPDRFVELARWVFC